MTLARRVRLKADATGGSTLTSNVRQAGGESIDVQDVHLVRRTDVRYPIGGISVRTFNKNFAMSFDQIAAIIRL